MSSPPDGLLEIGRLGRPHGVRGEIYLSLVSDRPERRRAGSRVFVAGGWRTIEAIRPSNDRFLVVLEGLGVREEAAKLTNEVVYGEPIDDPAALWVHDLVGARIISVDGTEFGTCVAVIDNPAHAILETDRGVLVPVPFVTSREDGVVTVSPPEGLLDLQDNA
ncbi:MAG: ribosome maturation factor RimM [Actinomycetota bacterium]|jgi:16S rRNA processing protein RimM